MDARLVATVVGIGALATWAVWYLVRAAAGASLRRHRSDERGAALKPVDQAIVLANGTAADRQTRLSRSAMVAAWAEGRTCVSCGGPLLDSRLHHIALLEPTGITREWTEISEGRLPLALATCLPMCWNCHLAATFRRMHPELVTDREDAEFRVHH